MAKVRANPIPDGLGGKLGRRISIRKSSKMIAALLAAAPGSFQTGEGTGLE